MRKAIYGALLSWLLLWVEGYRGSILLYVFRFGAPFLHSFRAFLKILAQKQLLLSGTIMNFLLKNFSYFWESGVEREGRYLPILSQSPE